MFEDVWKKQKSEIFVVRSQNKDPKTLVGWLVYFRMGWYEKRSELIVNHGPVCVYTPHTHPKRNEGEKEMTRPGPSPSTQLYCESIDAHSKTKMSYN